MTTPSQPPELLPCPFCGRPAKLREWPKFLGQKHFSVECTVDHSFQCPSGRHYLLKTADEAVAAWNTRSTPQPAQMKTAEEWRPIETAPRSDWNKTYILAIDSKRRMAIGFMKGPTFISAKPIDRPTHWTPLPEPPQDAIRSVLGKEGDVK